MPLPDRIPKKILVPYLVLRGFGALAVGATVAFGLFLGADIYGRVSDEIATLTAVTAPIQSPLRNFPQDTAALEKMAESMVKDTADLATTAEEMQRIAPASGDEAPSGTNQKK